MTVCSFSYIEDDLNGFSPEVKEELTSEHIRIAKDLVRHRNTKGEKIFNLINDKLVVPFNSAQYHQAKKYINNINESGKVVELIRDINNPLRAYVTIDVRPIASRVLEVDQDSRANFYKNFLGDSAIIFSEESFDNAIEAVDFLPTWEKISKSIKGRLSVYLDSLPRSGDNFSKKQTQMQIESLLAYLNDPKTENIITGLNQYIVNSSINLNNMSARLANINKMLESLSDDPIQKKNQLKTIADFVRQSSYYYHLFDVLEDIDTQIQLQEIDVKAIESYQTDLLEDNLKSLLTEKGFNEEETLEFLNNVPVAIENPSQMLSDLTSQYLGKVGSVPYDMIADLQNKYNKILKDSLKQNGNIIQTLRQTITKTRGLKSELRRLHYDTLVEVYFPVLESVHAKATEEYKEKYPLDKERFKTLLAIGEEDIDSITKWGSAMINVNELVAQTVALYFKQVMINSNIQSNSDVMDLQRVIVDREQSDLDNLYNLATYESSVIEGIKPVDGTYEPAPDEEILTFTIFGEDKSYIARKTKNILSDTNELLFHNIQKVYYDNITTKAKELTDLIMEDKYALQYLKDSSSGILKQLHSNIYIGKGGYIQNRIAKYIDLGDAEEVENFIAQKLKTIFNKQHFRYLNNDEKRDWFDRKGLLNIFGDFADLNEEINLDIRKEVTKNSFAIDYKNENLEDIISGNPSILFGVDGNTLVRLKDGSYKFIQYTNVADLVTLSEPVENIAMFFIGTNEMRKLKDHYKIENGGFGDENKSKWDSIQSNDFNRGLYNTLINKYSGAVDNMGVSALKYNEVPQVTKLQNESKVEKIKILANDIKTGNTEKFFDYAKSFLVKDNKKERKNEAGEYIDEDGNVVSEPQYESTESQYVNGQKVRDIKAKFTRSVPITDLETDLYKSILLYKVSSNTFKSLQDNESQALLLQSVIEGDKTLGIDPRKMTVKKDRKNVGVAGGQIAYKEHGIKTSEMILSFINDYVYNVNQEDYGILGTKVSAKKVANILNTANAFNVLAFNVLTMPSNAIISLHNTRLIAKGNEFFNEEDWQNALGEYTTALPEFLSDFTGDKLTIQKSPISQMIIRFNAIQGEFIAPTGELISKNVGEKLLDSSLFWTQEVVEHANQTQSMIMMMMGYKLPSGNSLWSEVKKLNVGRVGQELLMPEEFTPDIEKDFQVKLQAANLVIHGNYSSLDKNMMQKSIFLNMLMTFRKFIYDGFRVRFQSERPDLQTGTVREGWFRTYFKQLNKELVEQVKTQGLTRDNAWGVTKGIATGLFKSTLSGLDAAAFGVGSKNNSEFKDFIHGADLSERQRYAAIRSAYGIGNVIRAMLLVSFVQALAENADDDDENYKKFLAYIELYSRKLEGDLGMFESFTNLTNGIPGLTTFDQFRKVTKSPLVAYRTIDNTVGLFAQLTDFDYRDDEGNLSFQWGALDRYEKSGKGFEKGDLKINKKITKSIISPLFQMQKAFNPQQTLDYMNMIYSNSQ